MLLSIIVPSLRPQLVKKGIKAIHECAEGLDYEVIIVSPFNISPHPNVVHIKEGKSEGFGEAFYMGYKEAKGEYIVHINDHCKVVTPLKHMVEFMKLHDNEIFLGRFFTIDVKRSNGKDPFVGAAIPSGENYTEMWRNGDYRDHAIMVFGKVFAHLMCIRKDKAEEIGGFFDYPYYKAWYMDPDLSLRVWKAGGKVETCEKARIVVFPKPESDTVESDSVKKYMQRDAEAFRKRWGREFSHE